MRFWKPITYVVPPKDLPPRGFAEDFDHRAYMGDRFGRRAQERDQTFPWVLSNQSHPSIFFYRLVNDRVLVDFFQNRIQIFIQPEKLNQERLFDSLIEKGFSSLPEGKNSIRGLNDVGIEDFGKSKKLSAFQGMVK